TEEVGVQDEWLMDEHVVMDCFYEAKQALNFPQIVGCCERKTGGYTPADLASVLRSLVGKGLLDGPHGSLQTYGLTGAGRDMDSRARLQQRFLFVETLYGYG